MWPHVAVAAGAWVNTLTTLSVGGACHACQGGVHVNCCWMAARMHASTRGAINPCVLVHELRARVWPALAPRSCHGPHVCGRCCLLAAAKGGVHASPCLVCGCRGCAPVVAACCGCGRGCVCCRGRRPSMQALGGSLPHRGHAWQLLPGELLAGCCMGRGPVRGGLFLHGMQAWPAVWRCPCMRQHGTLPPTWDYVCSDGVARGVTLARVRTKGLAGAT